MQNFGWKQLQQMKPTKRKKPRRFYEVIPFIYMLTGILAVTAPEKLGRVSGVMLVIAATLILHMRHTYRVEQPYRGR